MFARAAAPPQIVDTWATDVGVSSATLHSSIVPNEPAAHYRFEVIREAEFEANLERGEGGFSGASRIPSPDGALGFGSSTIAVRQTPISLSAGTAYRYRAVAYNAAGEVSSVPLRFVTVTSRTGALLLDGRGWEMVSPVDKNGGAVAAPGALAGGGVMQAAGYGDSVTYGSAASFGADAQAASYGSQYIARRGGVGWASGNITTPMLSGSYGIGDDGVPYQVFSADLARGLLLNGRHCRGEGEDCPVANPPLPGSGAPVGYQNYYLRDSAGGGFRALIGTGELAHTTLSASRFDVFLAGAAPDLTHAVLSSCAALTADATEVPDGEGCDPTKQNLYESSEAGLSLLNLLPGDTQGTPGATLATPGGAISDDGGRVYWRSLANGSLYLHEGSQNKQVDAEGTFETASADGSIAFYTKIGHLYRYVAAGEVSTDLTPTGGVQGVLGASPDGSFVYYRTGAGLFLWHAGTTTEVAAGADPGDYPPATGTSRIAPGGELAFVAGAPLTGYDNVEAEKADCGDPATGGDRCSEVYLYEPGSGGLICVSCNPTGERPSGDSTLPGARPNGKGSDAFDAYKPRALSDSGDRVFFDSSDGLVAGDNGSSPDVYEWEAQGVGSCVASGGCLALVSGGGSTASFADASSDGDDVFFFTAGSLVGADPGSVDLYDARVGGGFPQPPEPIACEGDACQIIPAEPIDPGLGTTIPGPGNPPVRFHKPRRRRHARQHRRHRHQHHRHRRATGRR